VRSGRTQPSLGGVRGALVAVLSRGYVDLFCCAGLMIAVLALTLSRSGLVALGVAAVMIAVLSGRRRSRAVAAGAIVVSGAIAVAIWLNAAQAVDELSSVAQSQGNRVVIWRETLPIIRDFAVAGTGAGTFPDAMLQYQRTSTFMLFNHAHNEYLNVLAEGGAVLLVLLVLFVALLLRVAARRWASDGGTPHWSRIGALAGLCGVAAQSVWEFPLRTPANLLLAALLVALIALPTRRPAAAQ
jgi:O-antigen ligase